MLLATELPRRHPMGLAETPGKVRLIGKTAAVRDGANQLRTVEQQGARQLHATVEHQLREGFACFLAQQVGKVIGGQECGSGRVRQVERWLMPLKFSALILSVMACRVMSAPTTPSVFPSFRLALLPAGLPADTLAHGYARQAIVAAGEGYVLSSREPVPQEVLPHGQALYHPR